MRFVSPRSPRYSFTPRGLVPLAFAGITLASAVLPATSVRSAGPTGRLTVIASPVNSVTTDMAGLNARGQVATAEVNGNRSRAFLWTAGKKRYLSGPNESFVADVNDAGVALCRALSSGNRPFLWKEGRRRALPERWGRAPITYVGIGPNETVIGLYRRGGVEDRSLSYRAGRFTNLGTLGDFTEARAINRRGSIIAYSNFRAALWRRGRLQDIGDFTPFGISNRDALVGNFIDFDGPHPVFWQAGKLTRLPEGARSSPTPRDVNSKNQVVGEDGHSALLWQNGELFDLNEVVADQQGFRLVRSLRVNDRGEILCTATREGSEEETLVLVTLTP